MGESVATWVMILLLLQLMARGIRQAWNFRKWGRESSVQQLSQGMSDKYLHLATSHLAALPIVRSIAAIDLERIYGTLTKLLV